MRHFSEVCFYSKENIMRMSAPPFSPDRSTFLAKFAKGNIYIPQTRKQIVRPPKAETCIHTCKCHAWGDWVLGTAIMLFDGDLFSLRLIRTTKTLFPLPGLWPRQFLAGSDGGMCSAALSANLLYALRQKNHPPNLFPPRAQWSGIIIPQP